MGRNADTQGEFEVQRSPKKKGNRAVEARLAVELERLKGLLGLDSELTVAWVPSSGKLSGEVREGVIYIYEEDEEKAIETLRHEAIDYLISTKIIKPLINIINTLIKSKEREIYLEKEKIIERLTKLIQP